jgi:hypothetical protein
VVSYFLRYFSSTSTEQISPIPPDLSPVSIRLALLFLLLHVDGYRRAPRGAPFCPRDHGLCEAQTSELSGPVAFERVFVGDGESSRLLQKAHAICKAATANFDVTIVKPGDETHRTVNDTESSEAYRMLEALAAKLHDAATGRGEKMTKEKAFANAFESNPALAQLAHRTPVGGWTFYPMPNFSPEALGRRR